MIRRWIACLAVVACSFLPATLPAQDVGGLILPRDSASTYPYSELGSRGCLWLNTGYGNAVGSMPMSWQYGVVFETGRHFQITAGAEFHLFDRFVGSIDAGYASTTYEPGEGSPGWSYEMQSMTMGVVVGMVSSFSDPVAVEGAVGLSYFNKEPNELFHPRVEAALRIQPRRTDVLMRLGVSYTNDAVLLRFSVGLKF